MFAATAAWKAEFPDAVAGALVLRDVTNPERAAALEARKRELEERLRAAPDPGDDPVLRAYEDYYRARGQTYHVAAQRRSVAVKGKPIPTRAALVEAMFMAELEHLVLTAGHDLEAIEPPVHVDATRAGDGYTLFSGKTVELAGGDMKMSDGRGIVSSILRGPDDRTRITQGTRHALFTAYAPPGVGVTLVERHLEAIAANVRLFSPDARTELLTTVAAAGG